MDELINENKELRKLINQQNDLILNLQSQIKILLKSHLSPTSSSSSANNSNNNNNNKNNTNTTNRIDTTNNKGNLKLSNDISKKDELLSTNLSSYSSNYSPPLPPILPSSPTKTPLGLSMSLFGDDEEEEEEDQDLNNSSTSNLITNITTPKPNISNNSLVDELKIPTPSQQLQELQKEQKEQQQKQNQQLQQHLKNSSSIQSFSSNSSSSNILSSKPTTTASDNTVTNSPQDVPMRSGRRLNQPTINNINSNFNKDMEKDSIDNSSIKSVSSKSTSFSNLPTSISNTSNLSSRYGDRKLQNSMNSDKHSIDNSTVNEEADKMKDEEDQANNTSIADTSINKSGYTLNSINSIDSSSKIDDTIESQLSQISDAIKSHTDLLSSTLSNTTISNSNNNVLPKAQNTRIYSHDNKITRSTSNAASTYMSSRIKPPTNEPPQVTQLQSLSKKLSNTSQPSPTLDLAPPTSLKLAFSEKNDSKSNVSSYTTPTSQEIPTFSNYSNNKEYAVTPDGFNDNTKFDNFASPNLTTDNYNNFNSPMYNYQNIATFQQPNNQNYQSVSNQYPQQPYPNTHQNYQNSNSQQPYYDQPPPNQRLAPPYDLSNQPNLTPQQSSKQFNNHSQQSFSRPSYQTPTSSTNNINNTSPHTPSGSSFNVLHTPKTDMDESLLFIKPDEFQTIFIKVVSTIHVNSSNIQHNSSSSKKSEDPKITLTINDRESNKEMWRIRKNLSQILTFDSEIRPIVEFFGLGSLPDKQSFLSTTPSKIETRRSILQNYFNSVFLMPHIPHMVLYKICLFLSLDFLNPLDDFKSGSRKEGFLVRRYKGLGNSWKIRWCQIESNYLEIYHHPGGQLQESIQLTNAQIGRQASDSVADDKGYRHAFLIMESTKSKLHTTPSKHFFCAETDEERDDWVTALIEFTEPSPSAESSPQKSRIEVDEIPTPVEYDKKFSYDNYSTNNNNNTSFNPNAYGDQVSTKTSTSNEEQSKKLKKRSYFSFRGRTNSNADESLPGGPPQSSASYQQQQQNPSKSQIFDNNNQYNNSYNYNNQSLNNLPAPNYNNGYNSSIPPTTQPDTSNSMQQYLNDLDLGNDITKSIFGKELELAYNLSNHEYMGKRIPSICFRCLDYLNKTGAIFEEGIFRLSGSASTIRQLKENFNTSYDLDLFSSSLKPDMHTVSGLFKTYLRELPNPILGVDVYNQLNQAILSNNSKSKTSTHFKEILNSSQTSQINYDLSYCIFKFLKSIMAENSINKMNLKNICIVFVPTLNLSLEVLSLILIDFEYIFENGSNPVSDSNREVLDLHIPTF
ncbi:BEM3 [Candida jiufengensis]|uniref:BEM3 n=1 Tax=Candida jiufengensis TaxID=497108 RepID=UPI002225AF13|nr:BEM3 [Candida jiufengensis]KAI5955197.1 BEM3 [Candida jiufengensis]